MRARILIEFKKAKGQEITDKMVNEKLIEHTKNMIDKFADEFKKYLKKNYLDVDVVTGVFK